MFIYRCLEYYSAFNFHSYNPVDIGKSTKTPVNHFLPLNTKSWICHSQANFHNPRATDARYIVPSHIPEIRILTVVLLTEGLPGWRTSTTICLLERSRFVMNLRVRIVTLPSTIVHLKYVIYHISHCTRKWVLARGKIIIFRNVRQIRPQLRKLTTKQLECKTKK